MCLPTYDIAILGSGPVGCALALALARHAPDPQRIALAGPPPRPHPANGSVDPRAIALNQGSRQFLEQLDAWPAHAAEIRTVHVSLAGQPGRTLIDQQTLGTPRLGCVVTYDELLETLHAAVAHCGVQRLPAQPAAPLAGNPVQLCADDATRTTRLALVSDGRRPQGVQRLYRQHAVVATVQASAPVPGRAFERFTPDGPLALLPHPAGDGLYSLVWCTTPQRAEALAGLPPTAFDTALQARFGQRLGTLHRTGETRTFPLSLHAGPSLQGPGIVALGNAAQTLHPVAGQGLNLGLRDVGQLAQNLGPWLARPDTPIQPLLARYARQRRLDRGLTLLITDTLPRITSSANPLLRHLCGLGLLALDCLPPLRNPLARHLMRGQRL